MDPLSGREVDLLDRLPEPVAVDQLGLVQTVDHLSEGVAPRAAGLADREVLARLKGSLWWTIPAEASSPHLQIAISNASRENPARRLAITRQPAIARLKTSTTKARGGLDSLG